MTPAAVLDHVPRIDRIDGLREFLNTPYAKPQLPSMDEWQAWDADTRAALDDERMRYLGNGVTVSTPQLAEIVRKVQFAMIHNRHRVTGRTGVMISGRGTMGKTTAAKAAIRTVYARYRRQHPGADESDMPVAFIEVPSAPTAKAVMLRIADSLSLTFSSSDTYPVLVDAVADFLTDAGTRLVVIDELHHLNKASLAHADSADVLKEISNKVPATFVYSGLDIHTGGLLAGDHGRQIAGRFTLTVLTRYRHASETDKRIWAQIVNGFEAALPLFDHPVGALDAHAARLHELSAGKLGTLSNLLVGAAEVLIDSQAGPGRERITPELLEMISVDIDAEAA